MLHNKEQTYIEKLTLIIFVKFVAQIVEEASRFGNELLTENAVWIFTTKAIKYMMKTNMFKAPILSSAWKYVKYETFISEGIRLLYVAKWRTWPQSSGRWSLTPLHRQNYSTSSELRFGLTQTNKAGTRSYLVVTLVVVITCVFRFERLTETRLWRQDYLKTIHT